MDAAGTAVNTGLGMITAGWNDKRQIKQQGKLNEQQYAIDGRALERQKAAELEMWKNTGPQAMTEQLKKAGLSPALQYGGAGGGGATTGGGGSGVNAPGAPSGGGEIMGIQLMNAQKKLLEAQTVKTQAEAKKTAGVDTELTNQQWRMATIAANLAAETYEETYRKIVDMAKIVANEAEVSGATKDEAIELKEGELVGLGLANELKKVGITKTEQEITNLVNQVAQRWKELSIQEQNAIINGKRYALEKFVKDIPDSTRITVEAVGRIAGAATGAKMKN